MVSHCANPNCQKPLHYLREGKVFLFSRKNNPRRKPGLQRLEHFWLCGACARNWTLTIDGDNELRLQEKSRRNSKTAYTATSTAAAL